MARIQRMLGWERRVVAIVAMSVSVLAMPYPYRNVMRIRDEAAHYCDNVRLVYRIAVVVQTTAQDAH